MIAVDHPYPSRWDRHFVLSDGRQIFARPTRSDDEALVLQLLKNVSAEDLRLRFFDSIKEFTHPFLARLTQFDSMMAFIAFDEINGETLGIVRVYSDLAGETGEYAILLRSDFKGHGLGWSLMQMIIEYSRSRDLKQIVGQVFQENSGMLTMCRDLGFKIKADTDDRGLCDVTLALGPAIASTPV